MSSTIFKATLSILEKHRTEGLSLTDRLKRPDFRWEHCVALLPELATVSKDVAIQIETDIRYAGYLAVERGRIMRRQKSAEKIIPENFDYSTIRHLRAEAREKLERIRPSTLAQAGRMSGITPADLALILVSLEGTRPDGI